MERRLAFVDIDVPAAAVRDSSLKLPVVSSSYGGAYIFGGRDFGGDALPAPLRWHRFILHARSGDPNTYRKALGRPEMMLWPRAVGCGACGFWGMGRVGRAGWLLRSRVRVVSTPDLGGDFGWGSVRKVLIDCVCVCEMVCAAGDCGGEYCCACIG